MPAWPPKSILCRGTTPPATLPEEDGEREEEPHDTIDTVMRCFPVPGEPWVHIYGMANYYSSLLLDHPPPAAGAPPLLVNGWQHTGGQPSPYRIVYGTHNPAVHGVVITSGTVIPNFSWTPRLAMETKGLYELLEAGPQGLGAEGGGTNILVLPASHGRVMRLFAHGDTWYIANSRRLEALPAQAEQPATTGLALLFEGCLLHYYPHNLRHFARDLDPERCWFFALYPGRGTMLFLAGARHVNAPRPWERAACSPMQHFAMNSSAWTWGSLCMTHSHPPSPSCRLCSLPARAPNCWENACTTCARSTQAAG